MTERYAGYDVLAKWDSPSFDAPTRRVLDRRLARVPQRRFLTLHEWTLLDAVVTRLIPQPERLHPIPITPWIDHKLAENHGEGFRYEGMPPLREAWRKGLAGVDAQAARLFSRGFNVLEPEAQDAVLNSIQLGDVDEAQWSGLPANRFFCSLLLRTVSGLYYAHPDAWSEIGFGGPASPRGYVRLGFNARDPWEAKEVR